MLTRKGCLQPTTRTSSVPCYVDHAHRLTLTFGQHVGIRSPMGSWKDYENDYEVGFVISHAEELEDIGWRGVVKKIRETVGNNPVYSTSSKLRMMLAAI